MRRVGGLWIAVPAVLLSLALAVWGVRATVGFAFFHPEHIQTFGWPAVVLYGAGMILLGGIGIPPAVMILPATAVWPFVVSFPLCLLSGLGASWLGFSLSRHFFRQTVSSRIPERVAQYEHRLETHAFSTVLVLRLLFYLFPPINWMLGVSAMSSRDFLLGTCLGMLPWTLAYVGTGRGLTVVVEALTPTQTLVVGAVVLVALAIWWRWAVRSNE